MPSSEDFKTIFEQLYAVPKKLTKNLEQHDFEQIIASAKDIFSASFDIEIKTNDAMARETRAAELTVSESLWIEGIGKLYSRQSSDKEKSSGFLYTLLNCWQPTEFIAGLIKMCSTPPLQQLLRKRVGSHDSLRLHTPIENGWQRRMNDALKENKEFPSPRLIEDLRNFTSQRIKTGTPCTVDSLIKPVLFASLVKDFER